MRMSPRIARSVLCVTLIASALGLRPPVASASTVDGHADTTWMTNGYVYATAQWGNVLFIGGHFTQVRSLPPGTPGGTYLKLSNLAAIDMTTSGPSPWWATSSTSAASSRPSTARATTTWPASTSTPT